VCELTGVFDLKGPTISHHLKVLKEAGLITGDRRGTWIYYHVSPDTLRMLGAVLTLDMADEAADEPAEPAGVSA
jgi:ArsR family transcriptional regulator